PALSPSGISYRRSKITRHDSVRETIVLQNRGERSGSAKRSANGARYLGHYFPLLLVAIEKAKDIRPHLRDHAAVVAVHLQVFEGVAALVLQELVESAAAFQRGRCAATFGQDQGGVVQAVEGVGGLVEEGAGH